MTGRFKKTSFCLIASCCALSFGAWASENRGLRGLGPAAGAPHPLFAASDASEAVVTFDAQVHYRHPQKPTQNQVDQQIEKQLDHLFGPMAASRFPGAPKQDQKITGLAIDGESGDYVISYHYAGTMVIGNGASTTYELVLPKDPETIYTEAQVMRNGEVTNPCTDLHYDTEGDFWYFWNPFQSGCKLKKGVNFDVIRAKVKRIANTEETYPEYDRLVGPDGVIRISILLGMNEPSEGKNPINSPDVNAQTFRDTRHGFSRLGFSGRRLTRKEIAEIVPKGTSPIPYVEEFEKKNAKATVKVVLFFGPTGIDDPSSAFHYYLKDALENSALLIYDGHSGLGGNLDIASIEDAESFKIAVNKDRYQIYFFNSCSSYTYYNTVFFGMKATKKDPRGTKNLDILANGLETAFNVMHDTNMALVKAIDQWSSGKPGPSYQDLAQDIDSDNLFSVNGDEDNPTHSP